MASRKHLRRLRKGVAKWDAWRKKNPEVLPELSEAGLAFVDLRGANLREAYLSGANLERADLREADLKRAILTEANLKNVYLACANLERAILTEANLERANLERANLSGANLSGANLSGANLERADLRGASFSGTRLDGVDLRKVKGLEEARSRGPSSVSSKTLEMSQGQIPEVFLKGCGFPDWLILSAKLFDPSLRQDEIIDLTYKIADVRGSSPIVPLSVFLSYSHEDAEFVEKIEQRLDGDGIRSWRDTHDMLAGPLEPQIDSAITAQRAVLLVLSENSVASEWVPWELDRARKAEEAAGGYKICPVALDDSWKDCRWPDRVISYLKDRYYVLPLHDWEDDEKFEPQYQKLKKGLGIYYRSEGEG